MYLLYHKMAFGHAEFKGSFLSALKDCSYVFDQLLRGIGGYANIIKVLGTLIGFDD